MIDYTPNPSMARIVKGRTMSGGLKMEILHLAWLPIAVLTIVGDVRCHASRST